MVISLKVQFKHDKPKCSSLTLVDIVLNHSVRNPVMSRKKKKEETKRKQMKNDKIKTKN